MKRLQFLAFAGGIVTILSVVCADTLLGGDPRMANREALTRDLQNLARRAQDYYRRSPSNGGGGGTFVGITADAPGIYKLTSKPTNNNGTFLIITAGTAVSVTLEARGTQMGTDGNPVEIDIEVFADSTALWYMN